MSTTSSEEIVLYSYFRSSSAWRIRNALNLKGIAHKIVPVSLLKAEQHNPEYVKLNPSRLVPLLIIDGHAMAQSLSILEYLEETRPEPALLPADAFKRQQVRQIANMIVSDTQPVQNQRVLQKVAEMLGDDSKKEVWAKYWITCNFQALEAVLVQTAGKYCVGDDVTMADAVLVPQVYNAIRYKVDMTAFPTISRINTACLDLPAFQSAHPSKQIDCPPEAK